MHVSAHSTRLLMAAGLLALAVPVFAQSGQPRKPCGDYSDSDRPTHCEVRNQTVPLVGDTLTVDATPNGGVSVRGWDRQEIQLESRVLVTADTDAQARALAAQVRVLADGGRIRAEGPRVDGASWSVSFDVMVPTQGNLDLRSTNGGIAIEGVQGRLAFRTTNGGVKLTKVNGDVRGGTVNGGVSIQLDGTGWYGEGLDVETQNGGVRLTVPEGYSAHLEAGTRMGGVRVDFPIPQEGRDRRSVTADLGSGGAPIRLRTVNGGVSVQKLQ